MKTNQTLWKTILGFLKATRWFGVSLDNLLVKFLYGIVSVILIVWMLPSERPFEYSNLTVGSIAPEEIIAPFKFGIQKTPEELEQERAQARLKVPPVFDRLSEIGNVQQITLNTFFDELNNFLKTRPLLRPSGTGLDSAANARLDSLLLRFQNTYGVTLHRGELVLLDSLAQRGTLSRLARELQKALDAVYRQGIIDRPKSEIPEKEVVVAEEGIEERFPVGEVLDLGEAREQIYRLLMATFPEKSVELEIARRLVPAFLVPNLKFNQAITVERKEKAAHDVPLIKGYVKRNERIIDSHEIVTQEVYQKLQSLSLALQERAAARTGWAQLKFAAGKYLFAVILLVLALLYLYFYRKSLFDNNLLLGMVTLIFLLQLAGAAVITRLLELSPLAIPLLLAPMLLSILLDFGVAFIFTVTLSLILGASLSNDYTFTFMMLVVGSVAVFSVQKIRNRGHMFRAILFILLAYLVVHVIFGLLHFEPMKKLLVDFTIYLVPNAILVPTIVYLLIGIFERVFDVTTDISLLELSDLNHPLLKQLSVKAPGTFHHSIMVANLAEAAAEAIKANALLTRVGAYFHDVGKMFKPEYFIENQMGGVNKHDSLTPHMSCLILANHVKAGLELADKHNLPRSVKQFIAEHHGTSLMTFFYHKAVENGDSKEINENDFRYPGPKPQSKETAILMLADSVEAASRTLQNPTPQRIRNLVNTLVENKIKEGQLDECNLTLQEIREIKEAFIPILTGIHHLRIEYPAEALDRDKRGEREKRPVENRGERTVKTGPVPQPTPSTGKKTDTETGKEEYGYGS